MQAASNMDAHRHALAVREAGDDGAAAHPTARIAVVEYAPAIHVQHTPPHPVHMKAPEIHGISEDVHRHVAEFHVLVIGAAEQSELVSDLRVSAINDRII